MAAIIQLGKPLDNHYFYPLRDTFWAFDDLDIQA